MTTEPAPLVPGDATEIATRARYLGWACAGAQIAVQLAGTRSDPVRWPQRPVTADSGLRSYVSVQGSLARFPIRSYGSEEPWPSARGSCPRSSEVVEPCR